MDIFDVPSSLFVDIFTKWLNSKDFAIFDTAVCNKKQRRKFVNQISEEAFILTGRSLSSQTYLDWLNVRKLKVDKIVIESQYLVFENALYQIDFSALHSLVLKTNKNINVATECFQRLFVKCPNLKQIDLGKLFDTSFGKIGMFCPKIESITVTDCIGFNDAAVGNITQHLRDNLLYMSCKGCEQLTSASLVVIANNSVGLKHLNISYTSFSETSILMCIEKCTYLTHLHLEGIADVKDAVIRKIVQFSKNLVYLNVDFCGDQAVDGISADALKLVTDTCKNIEEFINADVHYKVRQGKAQLKLKGSFCRIFKILLILGSSPTTLHTLDMRECVKCNDECLRLIASRFGSHLSALLIRSIGVNGTVTDAGVREVAENCRNLTVFDAVECIFLSDGALDALATYCPLLTELNVSRCPEITDTGIQSILQHCPALTNLDVSYCTRLTDAAILYSASLKNDVTSISSCSSNDSCPMMIKHLSIMNCPLVTNDAIIQFASRNTELRKLTLGSHHFSAIAHIKYYKHLFPSGLVIIS